MLRPLGIDPQVFHTNEGHAGFLGLERIRLLVAAASRRGGAGDGARRLRVHHAHAGAAGHRPLPPRADRAVLRGVRRRSCGVGIDELMALGHRTDEPDETRFNMAVMGMRLAERRNGVAALHGEVSREMFADLWPDVPVDEVPIGSVTNGVHAPTWVSGELHGLDPADAGRGTGAHERMGSGSEVGDDELWRAWHGRERLVAFVRDRLRQSRLAVGVSTSELGWTDDVLDPTIAHDGLRPTLRHLQAGHVAVEPAGTPPGAAVRRGAPGPADLRRQGPPRRRRGQGADPASSRSNDPDSRADRFVFIDDYDMSVSRTCSKGATCGSTPRRPQEACGTSGMKAAFNGALNCSVLDGWWDECFERDVGWAIASAEDEPNLQRRDELEAANLFDLIEQQIVPLYYDHGPGAVPRGWLGRVKRLCLARAEGHRRRMVRDYVQDYYGPRRRRRTSRSRSGAARGHALAAWRRT